MISAKLHELLAVLLMRGLFTQRFQKVFVCLLRHRLIPRTGERRPWIRVPPWTSVCSSPKFHVCTVGSLFIRREQLPRGFTKLEDQIEKTLAQLKETKDPFLRREVLKELRRLLGEADRALKKPAQ